MNSFNDMIQHIKLVVENPAPSGIDYGAASVGVLAWLKMAPEVAGMFTVIWLGIRIFIALRDEVFGRKGKKNVD